MKVAAIAGGIGGSKLLLGLYKRKRSLELTIVGNTGDDIELYGLRICPDLDTITYTLAGEADPERGWGLEEDTFACTDEMARLGAENTWFKLGDRDLATHIRRTRLLRQGWPLSRVTAKLAQARGLKCRLIPMSEDYLPTFLETDAGRLHVQEYLVRERTQPAVAEVVYSGSGKASGRALDALREADAVVICPSNPYLSIGPILGLAELRQTIVSSNIPVVAVTPVVKGRSLKGPTAKMMRQMGREASAESAAGLYSGIATDFVLDIEDSRLASAIEQLGLRCHCAPTVMRTLEDKVFLADFVVSVIESSGKARRVANEVPTDTGQDARSGEGAS